MATRSGVLAILLSSINAACVGNPSKSAFCKRARAFDLIFDVSLSYVCVSHISWTSITEINVIYSIYIMKFYLVLQNTHTLPFASVQQALQESEHFLLDIYNEEKHFETYLE